MHDLEISGGTLGRDDVAALLGQPDFSIRFADVDFSGTDLSRLPLEHCDFQRCILIGATFLAAQLEGSTWTNCRGGEAIFESAKLQDAVFTNCDLNNTRWQRAKLSHAHFTGCKLTGANLSYCDTLGLTFSETLLRSAFMRGISFSKTTLENLDFTDADLTDADFRDAVFEGGSLAHARIRGARFAGADLRGADLSGFNLGDAKLFKGATISRAQASMLLSDLGVSVV